MSRPFRIVLFCAIASGGTLQAAGNAVVNPGFDLDPTAGNGWTAANTVTWDTTNGNPFPSVQMSSFNSTAASVSQCIDLTSGILAGVASFDFGGDLNNGVDRGTRGIRLNFFTSTTCTTAVGAASTVGASTPTGVWSHYSQAGVAKPVGANSVKITAFLTGQDVDNPGFASYDNIFFGPTGPGANVSVVNPGFDLDPTAGNGWTAVNAVTWDTSSGNPLPSAQMASFSGTASSVSQCIDLTGGVLAGVASFDFGGDLRNGVDRGTRGIRLNFFTSTTCTTAVGAASTVGAPTPTGVWTHYTLTGVAKPVGANSVRITAFVTGQDVDNPGIASYDNIFFGPPGTVPVSLQAFGAE